MGVMPIKKHHIRLAPNERIQLEAILSKGKSSAHRQRHARILLLADANRPAGGQSDSQIASAAQTSIVTVERVRRICVEHGLERALEPKDPEREYLRKLDGHAEAKHLALSCSSAPPGRARWTLRLLAARIVELEILATISHETVRQTLKKNEIKPWQKKQWVIPPTGNAEFVAAMEDVLEVYARPPDPKRPLVCMDECTKQLTRETRAPQAAAPGQTAREDYEYERNGVAAIFCAVAPHLGWRQIEERERKTRADYAAFLRTLADEHFPRAERIVLVQDNLNIHSPASLYEAFPPAEAARLKARFEFHFTPKHGSWLNIAEIELSALARGCLARRIPDRPTLAAQICAWQGDRNQAVKRIRWQFTTADARIKLVKLYPSLHK
jgi:transposase